MKLNQVLGNRTIAIVVAVSALIILFPLGYSVVGVAFSPPRPFLEKPDEKHENCVRDTSYMRFHHMDLLKELREEAVREGKGGEISVNSCRECHTSRKQFCNQCHNAVNLYVDCFGCHYYPLEDER